MDTGGLDPIVVERELRSLLVGTRLVGELDLAVDGRLYLGARGVVSGCVDRRYGVERIARLYPACLAALLVAEGREYYDGGYYEHLSVPLDHGTLGQAFVDSLGALGLERFPWVRPEGAYKWVAKILLHGGIPRFCAGDVLARLNTELRRGAVDAAEIVASWNADPDRLVGVDRPARRFLLEGGDIAVDLLDRLIDLATLPSGQEPDPIALGLPTYLVEEWIKFGLGAGGARRARLRVPRIIFDPWSSEGPELELPVVPADRKGSTWLLHLDRVRRIPASTASFTSATLPPSSRWRVELVNGDTVTAAYTFGGSKAVNALLFDPDSGVLLRDQERVRSDRVLALLGRGVRLTVEGGATEHVEDLPPLDGRWAAWSPHHLRLEIGARLCFTYDDRTACIPVVGEGLRPRLVGTPVPHVCGPDGRTVFASPPGLRIDVVSVPAERWRIDVRPDGSVDSVGLTDDASRLGPGPDRSLEGFGLAGLFAGTVSVRGPLGADLRPTSFALARGLSIVVPDRLLGPDAAASVEVSVAAPAQLSGANNGRVAIPAGADEAPLVIKQGDRRLELTVFVPRVQWALRGPMVGAVPFAARAVDVTADDLVSGQVDALLVRTRRPAAVSLVLKTGGRDLQTLGPADTGGSDNRWTFNLRAFGDSVRLADSALLALELRSGDVQIEVGRVHARYEASNISVESLVGGPAGETLLDIHFDENRRFVDRELRLWSVTRPWHRVERFAIPDGADGQAEIFSDAGRLPAGRYLAEVGIDDPWAQPRRPRPGGAGSAALDIGTAADEHSYLHALDVSEPLSALELAIVRPNDPRTRRLRADELPSVVPQLLVALLALIDTEGARAVERRSFSSLRDVALDEPDLLAAALRRLVADGAFEAAHADRLAIALLPDLVDCPLEAADEPARDSLHRLAPIAAAALDRPDLDDPESVRRWLVHTGWRPSNDSFPKLGGPVQAHMLGWEVERIEQLRIALDASDHRPLGKDGLPLAMFAMLSHRALAGNEAIASWRSRFGRLWDGRSRQLSERHAEQLRAIAPVQETEAIGRMLPELQAAAFHLVSIQRQRVAATDALLGAYEIAPALARRCAMVAVILHRAKD